MTRLREFHGIPPQPDTLTLDRLQGILNKAGISDEEIIAGPEFTHVGYQRLARQMGVQFTDIQSYLNQLMEKLRGDQHHMNEAYTKFLDEDAERFSYEADFLGNVTIRDSETGNSAFLQGSEGAELLNALKGGHGNEQEILAHYMTQPVSESADADGDDSGSYEDEIGSNTGGTYNFPWSLNDKRGIATAEFSGKGKIKIVWVANAKGEKMPMTPDLNAALIQQAVKFIPDA